MNQVLSTSPKITFAKGFKEQELPLNDYTKAWFKDKRNNDIVKNLLPWGFGLHYVVEGLILYFDTIRDNIRRMLSISAEIDPMNNPLWIDLFCDILRTNPGAKVLSHGWRESEKDRNAKWDRWLYNITGSTARLVQEHAAAIEFLRVNSGNDTGRGTPYMTWPWQPRETQQSHSQATQRANL